MDAFERALSIMERMPGILHNVYATIPASEMAVRPTPDEWSPQEVLAHLLHIETGVLGPRISGMARGEIETIGPAGDAPPIGDPRSALAEWSAARQLNLAMLRSLTPEQLARTAQHRLGPLSVREHVVEWSYHDLDHLRQVLASVQAALHPEIGAFRNLYPQPFQGRTAG